MTLNDRYVSINVLLKEKPILEVQAESCHCKNEGNVFFGVGLQLFLRKSYRDLSPEFRARYDPTELNCLTCIAYCSLQLQQLDIFK